MTPDDPDGSEHRGESFATEAATAELWASQGWAHAATGVFVLLRGLARRDEALQIDRAAWDNTLAAAVWALTEKRAGRALPDVDREVTDEHIERLRRLATLGSEVLGGAPRTPELRDLAEACMTWFSPEWREIMALLPPGACDEFPLPDSPRSECAVIHEGDTCHVVSKRFYEAWSVLYRGRRG